MLIRKLKLKLCACLFIILCACTKEQIPSAPSIVKDNAVQLSTQASQTTYGLIEDSATDDQTKADMQKAGVNLLRLGVALSQKTANRSIDNYLDSGYNVQILLNWDNAVNGFRVFPTDTNLIKSKADDFFQHYSAYKNQIPFIAVENEWDYQVQNGANLQDYIKELSVITTEGHKYGFVIADGGITSGALQRWTYSQLSATAQQQWKLNYYVGLHNNYDALTNIVNTYIASAKSINFDYSNVHWYNPATCGNGYATAMQTFMKACNKGTSVCNEFGIRTNSLDLFTQTVNEINGSAFYALAYSGSDKPNKAIKLTDPMLSVLNK
jgi:hypothetical protein